MRVTRLYTGEEGQSHFEEIDIPVAHAGDVGSLSEKFKATGIIFRETDGDYFYDWHNPSCRQFIIMLNGQVEVQIGSGERRIFSTGDILLAEDVTGQGHVSKAVNGQPRQSIFVTLA